MPGFFISNRTDLSIIDNEYQDHCVKDSLRCGSYLIQRNTLNKYLDDKLFADHRDYIIVLEGIVLNKQELMSDYGCEAFLDTVQQMIGEDPKTFYKQFRGSFSGALYIKEQSEWLLFCDHIGSRPVYYYSVSDLFVAGSQLNYISAALQQAGIAYQPQLEYFQYMATYGYGLDERTLIRGVNRLLPGHYMTYNSKGLYVKQYCRITNEPDYSITDQEAVETLDRLFRISLDRIYKKDKEYGYQTIADISGGMDSRAVVYASKELGYNDVLCTSFSQTNSYEQEISEELSADLGYDFLFYSLDNASQTYDIDAITRMNNGSCYYFGIGGMKRILDTLDTRNIGISINGIFGDVYEGGHLYRTTEEGYQRCGINDRKACKCMSRLLDIRLDEHCMERFSNVEEFLFNVRDMFANMNTGHTKQNYIEAVTPFGDVDFLKYFYSLPRQMRIDRHIGLQWMKKKYPRSLDFRYAATNKKPLTNHFYLKVTSKLSRMGRQLIKPQKLDRHLMNPFEHWYQNNDRMRKFIHEYYQNHHALADAHPEIQSYVDILYIRGNTIEKLMAIGLLSCLKNYF